MVAFFNFKSQDDGLKGLKFLSNFLVLVKKLSF